MKAGPLDNIEALVEDLANRLKTALVALDLAERHGPANAHLTDAKEELDSASVSVARLSRLVSGL